MEETATVVGIFGNRLKLSFTSQESAGDFSRGDSFRSLCKKCGACRKSENGIMYLELENTVGANVGDKVLVKIKPSNLEISIILYGIPSAMFIAGIFSGYFLSNSEIYGFLTGVLFLIFSILPVKNFAEKYKPKLIKIILTEKK